MDLELEIFCRNAGEQTKFRGAFDFDKPSDIPKSVKVKVSSKTMSKILSLPYDEVLSWFAVLDTPQLTFAHFWDFCHRFGGNRYEHGDPESYQKAQLVLQHLIKNNYKMTNIPKLIFASHDEKKIILIQEALEKLDCPIYKIPKLDEKRNSHVSKKWNIWLDARRDPEKVVEGWGDLDVIE